MKIAKLILPFTVALFLLLLSFSSKFRGWVIPADLNEWSIFDTWIVIAGCLSAMSCSLLGNFLILRRLSMMGDAISHAVLPGLAIAFLVTQSTSSLAMFVGAAVVGVMTAVFTQSILHFGKVEQSASMGVVFTTLFALGLILIRQAADSVHIDADCVLYGAIEFVPLDSYMIGDKPLAITIDGVLEPVPRAVVLLSVVFAFDLAVILLFYKEMKLSSFDPALATTLGINSHLMHYLLMTLVAITTVASFESVGSILVIAMLIVPGAAAHLLTDRLPWMIGVSLIIGMLCSVLGHISAIVVPGWFGFHEQSGIGMSTNTSGMMAVVAGLILLVTMFLAPHHGLFSKVFHRLILSLQITREDILGLLYRLEEDDLKDRVDSAIRLFRQAMGAGPILRWLSLKSLELGGLISKEGEEFQLTEIGREKAGQLIRSHRLWESYLHKHFELSLNRLHRSAERLEHITDPELGQRLAEAVDLPTTDPQGRLIPPPSKDS
ncbi:MAG: metal ABC transporter permease [Planctomycetota bacterium]|nr:metal ABC transporter permease [Planctomycetota bacterium]MDA1139146.1 metal ABC transporter permease [Planctomycetota bacterium]